MRVKLLFLLCDFIVYILYLILVVSVALSRSMHKQLSYRRRRSSVSKMQFLGEVNQIDRGAKHNHLFPDIKKISFSIE
mgnify:CR=1 FL=1